MKNTLYYSVALMVTVWAFLFFAYHIANSYILLVIAAIIVLIRLFFGHILDRY